MITLPGLTASIQDMITSPEEITSPDVTKLISYEPDAFLQSIVLTWPPHFNTQRANQLGFVRDASVDGIIRSYIEEERIVTIN